MRIATYNILDGGTGRIDPLAEVLRLANIDVAIIQECSDPANFHKLADRLGMDRFLADNPRNPEATVGLLSRLTIRQSINLAALDARLTRAAFSAVIQQNTAQLGIVGLHLHARETFADEDQRLAELPAILEAAAAFQELPHLIAGDFNTSHPDQIIDLGRLRPSSRQRIAPQNDQLPREVIRRMLAAGYLDAHAVQRQPRDFDASFTTAHPAMRVDFIFVPSAVASRIISCEVFKPEIGRFASDHFPVIAEITP